MKQSSTMKAANAQKRREAKTEVHRKLAEAIKVSLHSTGRKPGKGEIKATIKNIMASCNGGSPKFESYAEAAGGRRQEEPARSEMKTIPELNKAVKGLSEEVKVQERVVEKVEVQDQLVGKEELGVKLKEMEERMLGALSTGFKRGGEELGKRERKKEKRERISEVKEKKKEEREVISVTESSNEDDSESGETTSTEGSSSSSSSGSESDAEGERGRKRSRSKKGGVREKTMRKGKIIRKRARDAVNWERNQERSNPVALPGTNQATIAREKRLLADSAKIFEIIGGTIINLQKIKKNLGGKEKKRLGKEMEKLARMSVTGLNYLEINQEIYSKEELFQGDASLLLKFRDSVLRNLKRLDYDMKVIKIPESRELEKSMNTAKLVMKEALRNQGNGSSVYSNNMITPPTSPQFNNKYGTGVRSPDVRNCYNCNQAGHIATKCTAPCGICKQVGHQTRYCTKK